MKERPRPISIWRPKKADGRLVFERPPPGPFGDHYCATRRIPARRRRRFRVCLLGESTAAGYLLAPHLTPARALEARLGDSWEVVDLARTNERLETLAATAEAALQLAPDGFVLFTGNNWNLLETPEWSPYAPSSSARASYARALREAGITGPSRAAATSLRHGVERLFTRLAALGVPVTVVVPEVNLADWASPQPVAWLPERGVADWYRLLAAGRSALARGDLVEARQETERLLELDGGSAPTGFRLLAEIARRRGDLQRARTAARAEVDSVRYPLIATLPAPQATATAQELLRREAARHHFATVDLPEIFRRHDPLPGRRLFYDYCHLTPEGIDLAMTAVAGRLAGDPGCGTGGPLELASRARATAELGAAIHSVHRGLTGEPIRFWLRRAVVTHAPAAAVLRDLVAARTAPIPAVLTRRQITDPWLGHQHGLKWRYLDAELLAAAGEVLGWETVQPLLGPPRIEPWSALDRFYPEAMEHEDARMPLFLRSPWPWTDFALIASGPLELALVARLPGETAPETGRVRVSLAGRTLAELELGPRWTRTTLALPCRSGLNRLTLHWPLPQAEGRSRLARAATRLEAGRQADVHPVFGEVLDLRISASAKPRTRDRTPRG